jgi:hypothetical protein
MKKTSDVAINKVAKALKVPKIDRAPKPARTSRFTWLRSRPGGAAVTLHGKKVGRTPLKLRVQPEALPLRITFSLAGYHDAKRVIRKANAGDLTVTLQFMGSEWAEDPFGAKSLGSKKAKPVTAPARPETKTKTRTPPTKSRRGRLVDPFED